RAFIHQRWNNAGCSGDLLPPSPPAEKATTSKDQPWKSSTGDGAGSGRGAGNGSECNFLDIAVVCGRRFGAITRRPKNDGVKPERPALCSVTPTVIQTWGLLCEIPMQMSGCGLNSFGSMASRLSGSAAFALPVVADVGRGSLRRTFQHRHRLS